MAIVDEAEEQYLINCMGLTKEKIKEMLPSEISLHCDSIIKKRIEEQRLELLQAKQGKSR